jgi:hypothetical protein
MNPAPTTLEPILPARYAPFLSGRYDVKPNLKLFGHDFGNGPADRAVFQLDRDFPRYRAAKFAALAAHRDRHAACHDYSPAVASAVAAFIVRRLVADHPTVFHLGDARTLHCLHTHEELRFDADWTPLHSPYPNALEALACQLQEDLAVTCMIGDRQWLAALHICLPSHWTPGLKIGRSFAQVHAVVPGMEPINRRQLDYVRQMIQAVDGLVRFVWGVQRGDELNRHPDSPAAHAGGDWFIRVERQTIWGLPEVSASLFTIRPYLIDARQIRADAAMRQGLIAGLASMSEESARYKGVAECRQELIRWLDAG